MGFQHSLPPEQNPLSRLDSRWVVPACALTHQSIVLLRSRCSWWQNRYESTDPDFEFEYSDPEQNSDTEGGDMGDEDKLPGLPSPLKGVDDSSLGTGVQPPKEAC